MRLKSLSLAGWHFISLWKETVDFFHGIIYDYRWGGFWKADLLLRGLYFFRGPFSIARDFAKVRGDVDLYTFGKTPLATLATIACQAQVGVKEKVYDLGCGTGQTSFWWALRWGCACVAIDHLPAFIQKAKRVQQILQVPLDRLAFLEQDFFTLDYSEATFVYLYGTHLDDEQIARLIEALSSLPPGARVVTVSYSLTEYQKAPWFLLGKVFDGAYPWGTASLYLQTRTDYAPPSC